MTKKNCRILLILSYVIFFCDQIWYASMGGNLLYVESTTLFSVLSGAVAWMVISGSNLS